MDCICTAFSIQTIMKLDRTGRRLFHLLLNINRLSVVEGTGTEGAKGLCVESGKPGSGVTSERCIRNYLGGDKNPIAFKRSANLETRPGHRMHSNRVARSSTSFFTDRGLDQALFSRTGSISPRAGRLGWARLRLSEVSVHEGGC